MGWGGRGGEARAHGPHAPCRPCNETGRYSRSWRAGGFILPDARGEASHETARTSTDGRGQPDQTSDHPVPLNDGGPAKAPPAFGSTPATAVSLSAQAQAKAYAIKHGRDPDGVQDGK